MNTSTKKQSKGKNIALWILQALTALAFIGAGFAKLSGQAMMVAEFDHIGFGQWFRYLTGSIELVAGILLLVPKYTPVGALLLVGTMLGAILTHLFIIGGNPTPPIVLLAFAAIIAWGRRDRLDTLLDSVLSPKPAAASH